MSVRLPEIPDILQELPPRLRPKAEAVLNGNDILLAWFEPDLDDQLSFSQGLLLLTPTRLISVSDVDQGVGGTDGSDRRMVNREWYLTPEMALRIKEKGGASALELVNEHGLLAQWRNTQARGKAAHHFVDRWKQLRSGNQPADGDTTESSETLCPSCGLPIKGEQGICENCASLSGTKPAASLLRLLTFARKRAGIGLLGLFLTVASTAASMIPPYLTKPMLDRVLVPYQNGQPAEFYLVPWLLGGFAAASVLSWLLGWARTYVVAWVSERIASDLRNQTYAHLQRMSLEFFGGKRTGDLISRVSSDSDRIQYFLSVNLLDFAGDVLMIVMIAAVLLTLDLRLALATLAPLPLIAYLVHQVRGRLLGGFQLGSRTWADMTSVLADAIPGIRVVKAFAQERREVERFRRANDRVLAANDRVNWLWSFFGPVIALLTDGGLLVVWIVAVWQVYRNNLTIGTLNLFLAYIGRFYMRLDSMSRMLSATQRAAAFAAARSSASWIARRPWPSPFIPYIRAGYAAASNSAMLPSAMARAPSSKASTSRSSRAR